MSPASERFLMTFHWCIVCTLSVYSLNQMGLLNKYCNSQTLYFNTIATEATQTMYNVF